MNWTVRKLLSPETETHLPANLGSRWFLFILFATAPAIAVVLIAADLWRPALLILTLGVLVVLSIQNVRVALVLGVLIAGFTDYAMGGLIYRIGILVVWLVWCGFILLLRSRWMGWKLPPRSVLIALAVWQAACLLGAVNGLFVQNNIRFLLLELLSASWPLLALVVLQAFERKHFRLLLWSLVIMGLAQSGVGLVALHIAGHRLGGVFFTTIPAMVAVVLWILAILTERKELRTVAILTMIPLILHLFFSFTRGYWLAFIVAMVVATLLAWRTLLKTNPGARWRPARMLSALLLIGGVTATAAIFYAGGDVLDTASQRFSSAFRVEVEDRQTASNIFRLIEYAEAVRMASESPVVGKGFGAVLESEDPFLGVRTIQWFIHNYYLLTLVKLGAVGLLAFGFLIFRLIRNALKVVGGEACFEARVLGISAVALTIEVLVISLTNFNLAMITVAFFLALIWGAFWAMSYARAEVEG